MTFATQFQNGVCWRCIRSFPSSEWIVAICALAFFTGCATQPVPMGSRLVVSTPHAEFYRNGPAQDFDVAGLSQHNFNNVVLTQYSGPDFQLPKGAIVTMLKREAGFSKVVTDSGDAGYVANDQLKPAPPVARVMPVDTQPERSFHPRTRTMRPSPQMEEHLDMDDLPLPLPS